jgi:hypothetical protein
VRDRLTLEHAADQSDVEEKQNERLLHGNIEILKRVETLEQRILDLERTILQAIAGATPQGGAPAGDRPDPATSDTRGQPPA